MNKTKEEYREIVKKASPKTDLFMPCVRAFIVGGLICDVGQFITDMYMRSGASKELAATYTSVILIFMGVLLTGLGLYQKLGKFAGAGSIVPITGFANSVASPAIEFRAEGLIFGVGAKMFAIAGPVIVYGVSTSIIIGLIYYILNLSR